MGKSDDAKMAKLIRKNMAKAEKNAKSPIRLRKYDSTLPQNPEQDPETKAFFAEMKKREF